METKIIRSLIDAEPFQPFTITIRGGGRYTFNSSAEGELQGDNLLIWHGPENRKSFIDIKLITTIEQRA